MNAHADPALSVPNGVHHLAVMAADIKTHIAFFADVLGCPLVALFPMHGVPGGLHAFHRLNDACYFSIVQLPGVGQIASQIGQTHAGSGAGVSAAGTMQHLAFRVGSQDALLALRDRIRAHGVNVFGPIDHGMCQSIYFAGPDHLSLEVAVGQGAIDPRAWIDPQSCAAANISAEEMARFAAPQAYDGPANLPQPPYDPAKPHQAYPAKLYEMMLAMPDEVITATASHRDPPVRLAN